jgi:hypothetical protein
MKSKYNLKYTNIKKIIVLNKCSLLMDYLQQIDKP